MQFGHFGCKFVVLGKQKNDFSPIKLQKNKRSPLPRYDPKLLKAKKK